MKYTITTVLSGLILILFSGCEDEDFDYNPPPGKGSIIIDNNLYSEVQVFADGQLLGEVDDDDYEIFDIEPGVYRVILRERDNHRTFRDDIDVLEQRNTVLRIWSESDEYSDLDVTVEID